MRKEVETRLTEAGALVPKDIFTYGGIDWVVLDHAHGGVLALSERIVTHRLFDENAYYDFTASTLYEYLNRDLVTELEAEGADKAAFLTMPLDMTADDGLDDCGTGVAKIGLISCEQYRKYRKVIPDINDWWWTLTPHSTKRCGCIYLVRSVAIDGTLDSGSTYGSYSGVRPLCSLRPSTLVSVKYL